MNIDIGRSLPVISAATAMVLLATGAAAARSFAPPDRPGPALSVAPRDLAASLACHGDLSAAGQKPVLLVPGTASTPKTVFSWSYEQSFRQTGRPYCAVTLPHYALSDIQVSAEYIVYAMRAMSKATHRKIAVLGWSQGGMAPRFALRFWPDTRDDIDQLIALDPSNHGTVDASAACLTVAPAVCTPAIWQQALKSNFYAALNSYRQTFAGIAYTVIYSITDEIVVPNLPAASSSSLPANGPGQVANIAVQSVCPTDVSEHLAMGSYDAVGYALAADALDHGGVAERSRIPLSVCTQVAQPGVNLKTLPANFSRLGATAGEAALASRHMLHEPPLQPYVFAQ
jgi:hypothetical protein